MWRIALLATLLASARAEATGRPSPGAASPTKVRVPDAPGSIRGLAGPIDVEAASGQVRTSVSIDVPAGLGLTPSLSLVYSGDLGQGPLGVGWSLPIGAIRRSTRHGVPTFDDRDELEIDGVARGRLVSVGPDEYRVEASGNRYRVLREANRWLVYDGDGTRYFYGLTEDGRHESEGRTAAWHLELVVARNGATIAYRYERSLNESYPAEITWGPDGRYKVRLEREERPDAVVSFRSGIRTETRERIRVLRVTSSGRTLRTYSLTYDDSFSLSRLVRVDMSGLDGLGTLPPVSFVYASPAAAGVVAVPGLEGWHLDARGVSLVDLDGDGAEDLLRLETGSTRQRRNLGGTFAAEAPFGGALGAELATSQIADVDGDARPELIRIVDDTWRVSRIDWSTRSFAVPVVWPGSRGLPIGGDGSILADLNGDGAVDVLAGAASGLLVTFGSPTGFQPSRLVRAISAADPLVEPGNPDVRLGDLNGDGLADVAYVTDGWMKWFLGRGDGTFEPWRRVFWPGGLAPRDFVLADLNRDGLTDLVTFTIGHVLYYPALADGTFAAARHVDRPEGADADVVVTAADLNGNGSVDVVWSSPRGLWVLDLAGPTTGGMLVRIENGLGGTTSFAYESSTALAQADEASGRPWAERLPVAVPVPTQVTVSVGGPERVTRHRVRDGVWDGAERRFAGFLEAETVVPGPEPASNAVSTTTYHRGVGSDRVLRGLVVSERQADGLGNVLASGETDWIAHRIDGLPGGPLLRVPVAVAQRRYHHEGVATPLVTRTRTEVDGEGRPVRVWEDGRLDLVGDERRTEHTYATDDATRWIRDRECESRVYQGAESSAIVITRTLFGPLRGPPSAPCVVGEGLERRTEVWFAEESRWVATSLTEYDDRFNPSAQTASGVTHVFSYDASGLFLQREEVSPRAGAVLAWTLSWDEAQAIPVAATDPTGVETRVTHDPIGRLKSIATAGRAAHVRHEYEWHGPHPLVRTFVFDGAPETLGSLGPWRESVSIANSGGETQCVATRLSPTRWIVSGWTERDLRGRPVRRFEAFYWDGADPREILSPPAGTPSHSLTYDAFDRPRLRTLPTGASTRLTYGAFVETVETDDLAPVVATFDGLGRRVRTERVINDIVESLDAHYDALDHLAEVHLQEGVVTHRNEYDSLGRLVLATDPDIGPRHHRYDDAGRLVSSTNAASETIAYEYDGAGRLAVMEQPGGARFVYHYDAPLTSGTFRHVEGRLSWVEEPTGEVELGYDVDGRVDHYLRRIDDRSADVERTWAPSGLLLEERHSDGLVVPYVYDAAGRVTALGAWWQALTLDPAGRVLEERYGNGLVSRVSRDPVGQASRVELRRGTQALYDVLAERNAYGALTRLTDTDGVGLDESAFFTYDRAARLTEATLGTVNPYRFTYAYNALQNLTARTASGPRSIGALVGTYKYGELDPNDVNRGPRQLTSVRNGKTITRLGYDRAGRVIAQGSAIRSYNAFDQLVTASGVGPQGFEWVTHTYGHDGLRVKTQSASGGRELWFTPDLVERGGSRDHHLRLGDRLIARVTQRDDEYPPVHAPSGAGGFAGVLVGLVAASALLGRRRFVSVLAAVSLVASACGPWFRASQSASWSTGGTLYYHQGFGPGATLITRADGTIGEERRFEPFGVPLDSYREGSGGGIQSVDWGFDDTNSLNKHTNAITGLSDHGARWMDPSVARWLTPDPPVKTPDAELVAAPWKLNPYQYVEQNPVLFWDPDGRHPGLTEAIREVVADPRIFATLGPPAAFGLAAIRVGQIALLGVGVAGVAAVGAYVVYDWYSTKVEIEELQRTNAALTAELEVEVARRLDEAALAREAPRITKVDLKPKEEPRRDGNVTFYRGTSRFAAFEIVETQKFDVARIRAHQQAAMAPRSGVYITSQMGTAYSFGEASYGQERSGGVGVVKIVVPAARFRAFAAKYGIKVEEPVTRPLSSGQTETLLPFEAVPEFESFATFSMEPLK